MNVLIATNTHTRIVKRGTQLYSFLLTLLALLSSPSPFLCVSLFTQKHFLPEIPRGYIWRTETQLSFSFQSSITNSSGLTLILWQPACSCPSYFNSILWRLQLLGQTQGPPALSSPTVQTYSLSYCSLRLLPHIQLPRILLLGVDRILQFCIQKQRFHSPEEKGICKPNAFFKMLNSSCFLLILWRTTLVYRFHHNSSKPRQKERQQPRGELQRSLHDGRTDKPRKHWPNRAELENFRVVTARGNRPIMGKRTSTHV